jgi:hypothetical protein
MVNAAANDSVLLASAQQRVQKLLEEYVNNIGKAIGKNYSIEWKYIESDGNNSAEIADETIASDQTL